jgi:tetratricopeptide (TPR) repeat protein
LRKDFVNDPSPVVRKTLIELADDVGGKDDLGWLSERIGSNGESDLAWRAMLTIFNGSDVAVLNEWIDRFFSPGTTTKLSDQQRTAFLEAVEPRAAAENQPEMLKKVREHLAQLCVRTGRFERAEEYLRKLEESAPTANEKERVLSELMAVYLKWPKLDLAAGIVKKCLLERDLDPNDAVVRSIDDYLSNPPAGTDPNELLKSLRQIGNVPAGRPMWRQILNQWAVRLGKAAGPENLQGSGGGKEERAS